MAVKKGNNTKKEEAVGIKSDEATPQHIASVEIASTPIDYAAAILRLQNELSELKNNKNDKPESTGDSTYDKDLLDDWMETPAVFFTYKSYFAIFSDRIRGKISKVPSGEKIAFTTAMRYKRAKGKEEQVICISKAIINSKKDAEWLRNSNYFGTLIHETIKEVTGIDAQFAEDMQNASTKARSMTDMQIISACKSYGITLIEDIQSMRLSLVKKFADEEKNRKNSVSLRIAENASKDDKGNRKAKDLDFSSIGSGSQAGVSNANPYL